MINHWKKNATIVLSKTFSDEFKITQADVHRLCEAVESIVKCERILVGVVLLLSSHFDQSMYVENDLNQPEHHTYPAWWLWIPYRKALNLKLSLYHIDLHFKSQKMYICGHHETDDPNNYLCQLFPDGL